MAGLCQAGRGAEWVKESLRPWDPALAPNGQQQAQSAAKRLRQAGMSRLPSGNIGKDWKMMENGGLIWFNGMLWDLPSGNLLKFLKMTIEIEIVTFSIFQFVTRGYGEKSVHEG